MAEENRTSYGQFVADGQSTANLASSIVNLLGRPVSNYFSKQNAERDYRTKLGDWATEAVDVKGRWLQPILRCKDFEEHLIAENGQPKPQGTCESSLAWAQLLFALNIRPGQGVITWRLPPKTIQPGEEDVPLIVDGAAMCHLLNLFRIYEVPAPDTFSSDVPVSSSPEQKQKQGSNTCKFTFGYMNFDEQEQYKSTVTFNPGTLDELKQKKVPLCYGGVETKHLNFESSSLMAKYFSAVQDNIPLTDSAGIGPAPTPDQPVVERARYYMQAHRFLKSRHECSPDCVKRCRNFWNMHHEACTENCTQECVKKGRIDWSKPRLITHDWLSEIERIKRRVTTNGGHDDALLTFLVNSLRECPKFDEHASNLLKNPSCPQSPQSLQSEWVRIVTKILTGRFMFKQKGLYLKWNVFKVYASRNIEDELFDRAVDELRNILPELASNDSGHWYSKVLKLPEDTREIFFTDNLFEDVPVIVIELGPSHLFWQTEFKVKGQ